MISLQNNWICPKDTTETNPIFGRIDQEDLTENLFLAATFNLSKDFEGYILLDITDLKEYRIFKGKTEAQEFIALYWS